ncbi:MAG: zinc-ribbon domain-containing protein [Deltaproteobacteria bacterium]|nr:zinc-ribbon domain-containing protein [Deltaproteobacteria bacterium]MBW2123246.1 zinc-ribbon domain-containing protein [Deltaproteobacteria bacterium]
MIVECPRCHTRYRINELLFIENSRNVRCSRCRHVFTVAKVSRLSCSICGKEISRTEQYMIRYYRRSPYAICPLCANTYRGALGRDKQKG